MILSGVSLGTRRRTQQVQESAAPAGPAVKAAREPWGPYVPPGAGRDQRIDLLRGFAVLAMVVDHIAGPSVLYALTGGNRFYTSAAEGFIFISGLVMGLVYQRLIERDGLGPPLRRAIERAVTLYLITITLTLLFIPISELLGLHWAQGIDFSDPVAFIVSVLTLHRTYYLVDIPLLYTVLILVSPLALIMLSQGRTAVVLGASWLLWAAYQFFPEQAEVPWTIAGNYLFFLSAWQVFFFTGLVLGWHHRDLTQRLARFPRRPALIASGVGTMVLIVLYSLSNRLEQFLPDDADRAREIQLFALEYLFGKADVRPGRIIASIIVFGFLYLLVTEAWRPLRRATGWLLLPLGEHSLYAYAAHVVIAIPVALALDALTLPDRYARPLNFVVQIATLLLIWLLVRWRVLFINPARGYARFAWPVAVTAACLVLLPIGTSMAVPGIAAPEFESDAYDLRVARAFGTPVPGRAPRQETVVPLPRPSLRNQTRPSAALPPPKQVSPYVGALHGSLHSYGFFSRALDTDKPYYIYLPPGYDVEARRYPVLFMLHGNSGSLEEWAAYGLIDRADRMIAAREILPLIIVLPQGDFSYWLNLADNGPKYGDYVVGDLVRHINATYRVLPGPQNRAIGGLSMGGTGALVAAFTNPGVFGVVGAHSPALPAEGERDFLGEGPDYEKRDPISLAAHAARLNELLIWIDDGDEDDWIPRTQELHETLEERGLDHEYQIWRGDHDGEYWATHVPDYLRFYDRALNPDRRL
jgi:enterochelin esterase-like enzyme